MNPSSSSFASMQYFNSSQRTPTFEPSCISPDLYPTACQEGQTRTAFPQASSSIFSQPAFLHLSSPIIESLHHPFFLDLDLASVGTSPSMASDIATAPAQKDLSVSLQYPGHIADAECSPEIASSDDCLDSSLPLDSTGFGSNNIHDNGQATLPVGTWKRCKAEITSNPRFDLFPVDGDVDQSPSFKTIFTDDASAANDERPLHESYAHIICRALSQAPGKKLGLQQIYRWVERNTDKARDPASKGWQNSIRHNLSMNVAFQKEPVPHSKGKRPKNYLWVLQPDAIQHGIQPTTRYRRSLSGVFKSSRGLPRRSKHRNLPTDRLNLFKCASPTPSLGSRSSTMSLSDFSSTADLQSPRQSPESLPIHWMTHDTTAQKVSMTQSKSSMDPALQAFYSATLTATSRVQENLDQYSTQSYPEQSTSAHEIWHLCPQYWTGDLTMLTSPDATGMQYRAQQDPLGLYGQ